VADSVLLSLFDMDRTLVDTHTAKLYVRFQRDQREVGALTALRASFWLAQYTLGIVNAERVAAQVLADYRGKEEAWLAERCHDWFDRYVRPRVSSVGRDRVAEHRQRGSRIVIATSAVRQMVEPLARHLGIDDLVCSELQVEHGKLTGGVVAPLCYADGKRRRALALATAVGSDLGQASFYTDSITDAPLLEAVASPVAVNPDSRLRRLAVRRGWPIEEWLARS
jgi:HAD superfamily hydrolase (TIGR01490 family)